MDNVLVRDLERDDINELYQSLVSLCENSTSSSNPMVDVNRDDNFSLKTSIEAVKAFSYNDFNKNRFFLHLMCLDNISVKFPLKL